MSMDLMIDMLALLRQRVPTLLLEVCESGDVMVEPWLLCSVTLNGSFDPRRLDHFEAKDYSFSVVTSSGADGPQETPSGVTDLAVVAQQNCAQPILSCGGHRGAG